MLDLDRLLRVGSAYGGRFDASGERVLAIADLSGVPQVWGVRAGDWPELAVAPTDRAQTVWPGPRPGQLVVGADVGGDERTQLLYVPEEGARWQPLTESLAHIHQFGGWSADGNRVAYAANLRDQRWFDVYVRDLRTGETRVVLADDSTNHAEGFSPDGRWLLCRRLFSNAHHQLWLVDLEHPTRPPRRASSDPAPARYEQPSWTPDGGSIVCLTDLNRELAAPARIEVETGVMTYLVEPESEVDEIALAPNGRLLAYAINRDGASEIVVRDLASGQTRTVRGLPDGALYTYWQSALGWDRESQRLAISWTASRVGPNVWVVDLTAGQARQPDDACARAGLRATDLFEPEHVSYPSFDGREIPALYTRPTGGARPRRASSTSTVGPRASTGRPFSRSSSTWFRPVLPCCTRTCGAARATARPTSTWTTCG